MYPKCPKGGYQTASPRELCAVLAPYLRGELSTRSLRVFFAALEMKAIREATRRSRRPGRGPARRSCFRTAEIVRLTDGIPEPTVRRELRRLANAGVLVVASDRIDLGDGANQESPSLLRALSCGRSPSRAIPIPRPVLRYLARSTKRSLMLTAVGYLVRGLSLDRQTGEVKGKGTVKVSWIAETFALSERAAAYARAELIRASWVTKDVASYQRKLNRDGAYFELNLDWAAGEGTGVMGKQPPATGAAARSPFAPRLAKSMGGFAPPKEKLVNYSVGKDQKAPGSAPARPAGVSTKRGAGEPTLRDVKREDLEHFSRTEALYRQAVARGFVRQSEASFLNWVAAAIRAREANARDPVRVFVGIVRRGLWHHVTQAQEDRARRAISRYLDGRSHRATPRDGASRLDGEKPRISSLVRTSVRGLLSTQTPNGTSHLYGEC